MIYLLIRISYCDNMKQKVSESISEQVLGYQSPMNPVVSVTILLTSRAFFPHAFSLSIVNQYLVAFQFYLV